MGQIKPKCLDQSELLTTVIQSPKSSSSQTSKKLNKNNKSYDKLLFIQ